MTLHSRDLRDTASLRYRNRAENRRSYVWTEAQSRMVSCRRESYPVYTVDNRDTQRRFPPKYIQNTF